MEVISLYRFKKLNFNLIELGYTLPLDDILAQDLLYLENCLNEKQNLDLEKMRS